MLASLRALGVVIEHLDLDPAVLQLGPPDRPAQASAGL
jgi:hypothetical protein